MNIFFALKGFKLSLLSVDNALKLALEYGSYFIERHDKHASSQHFNRQSPVHSLIHLDADCKTYWSQWNMLIVKNGILYRRWICEKTESDLFELVVPETWRNDTVKIIHADPGAGHMGLKQTVEHIQSLAYWPRVTETVL